MDIIDFATQVLDLAEDSDYWKGEALKYKARDDEHISLLESELREHEERASKMLVTLLDPNNSLARMVRAVDRDPLHGALSQ